MKANGYEWLMNGNEITCDGLAVCEIEYVGDHWRIVGEDELRFGSRLKAFYFVMDRCV